MDNELKAYLVLISNQLELLHLDLQKTSNKHPTLEKPLQDAVDAQHEVVLAIRGVINTGDFGPIQF